MTYRYIKFAITKRRGGGSGYIQLSEIEFLDSNGSKYAWPAGTSASSSVNPTSSNENAARLIDGSTSTKFCGYTSGGVTFVIDLGESNTIDIRKYNRWRWYTANDYQDRDPVSFSLSFSNDGSMYTQLDSVSDGSITTSRYSLAYEGSLAPDYDVRYLIGDGDGKLYTVENDELTELSETAISKALFLSDGLIEIPDGQLLLSLENPRVYLWQDSDDDPPGICISVAETPKPQVVITENVHLSHSTIVGVENVTIVSDDNTLFAVSFDDGITWWNYINDTWALLSETLSGQTRETMEAISTNAWAQKITAGGTIKFRFVLSGGGYVESITIHYLN